ncbi:hypothetical protein ONE56_15445 [Vibrio mytili]|uniref:hypothetical protein n=1 Tax=Vibrio mytili TaxID=50718 RepID=UPI003C70548E
MEKTKKALASRAGFRCSFPGCDAVTVGPSEESDTAISNVGVACHITAAADGPGARRFDPDLSPEQRRSIQNGIWMCGKHSIEIDRDEVRFTVEKLKHWKIMAEEKAKIAHSHGADYLDKYSQFFFKELTPSDAVIDLEKISGANELIGNAVFDSSIRSVWGKKQAIVVRDLIVELCRNCFQSGSAKKFELNISTNIIEITYDGDEFNIFSLIGHEKGRGGEDVLREVIEEFRDSIAVSYHYEHANKVIVHRVADFEELECKLPCSVNLDLDDLNCTPATLGVHEKCGAIYIILPEHFVRSDINAIESQLSDIKFNGKPVFIVGRDLSNSTINALSSKLPHLELVHKVS